MCTVQCVLYNVYSTMCTVSKNYERNRVGGVQVREGVISNTLQRVQCVQCVLYNMYSTMYTVQYV